MRTISTQEVGIEELKKILSKPAFDQVVLSDRIREKNKTLFGEDLTAAQIVDKIVKGIREDGDKAVIDFTKLIDGVEFGSQ